VRVPISAQVYALKPGFQQLVQLAKYITCRTHNILKCKQRAHFGERGNRHASHFSHMRDATCARVLRLPARAGLSGSYAGTARESHMLLNFMRIERCLLVGHAASLADSQHTGEMLVLRLDTALTVLVLATSLMAVQLVIVTLELARVRRELLVLLRLTSALNHAVNPWASETEPTDPQRPPRLHRAARWFRTLRK